MSRIFFIDTAIPADRKKWGKHKMHTVFDGNKVFKVGRLTELDAKEIYIDSLLPQIYEELMELIEKGVRVFLLRNTRLLKRLREENRVKKSDEVDAKLLSMIPRNHFKQLTLRELNLLRLIGEYERYVKWRKTVQQWMRICPDPFKECVRRLRSLAEHHGRKIIREIKNDESYATIYRLACNMIGVKDSVEVAILVARLPLNWKLRRLKGLLGLAPYKDNNYYNHKLREYLSRLAANLYLNSKRFNKTELLKEVINNNKGLRTLEIKILRVLKKAWQQRRYTLAGGQ